MIESMNENTDCCKKRLLLLAGMPTWLALGPTELTVYHHLHALYVPINSSYRICRSCCLGVMRPSKRLSFRVFESLWHWEYMRSACSDLEACISYTIDLNGEFLVRPSYNLSGSIVSSNLNVCPMGKLIKNKKRRHATSIPPKGSRRVGDNASSALHRYFPLPQRPRHHHPQPLSHPHFHRFNPNSCLHPASSQHRLAGHHHYHEQRVGPSLILDNLRTPELSTHPALYQETQASEQKANDQGQTSLSFDPHAREVPPLASGIPIPSLPGSRKRKDRHASCPREPPCLVRAMMGVACVCDSIDLYPGDCNEISGIS